MSTGKRLAKRSILGTRVVAPGDDGRLYPGIIADMKTPEGGSSSTSNTSTNHIRYTVRFDENRKMKDFYEGEIIGPGFSAVTSSKLRPKQKVWVTNANREMEGYVLHHRPNIDQVIVQLNGGAEVKKKLEEVRLMESRKSARLIGQGNTDFSKLADFNIVHERKRLNSETSDMSSGTTCGRKRRGSETLSDSSGDEYFGMNGIISTSNQLSYWTQSPLSRQQLNSTPIIDPSSFQNGQGTTHGTNGEGCRSGPVMSECTAALVLMNLSHSPANSNYLSKNLNGDVRYSIKKDESGSASVLPSSTQLYLANLESNHIEDSQSKHKNQKSGHAGHVRCLPGGACLVGSDFISSSSSIRLPEDQVQEPTDLSQTSVSSTNISSNLDLSRTITTTNDTNVSQRSVETPTINSSPSIAGISESSSSSESSFPPTSSLCASTTLTRKTAAASPTLSTMSSCSASIASNASNGATIILPQFGTASNTNMERSVSPSSTSGASSLGNSWASTPTMVTVVPPSGAGNNGPINFINTSKNFNGQSSASASPTSSLLTSSSVHLTEAEALLQLSNQESDEGIVSDQSSSADPEDASKRVKIEHVRIIYQCTWPGCRVKTDVCVDIERHVRSKHLGRREPITEDDIDHEEEFYYTEVEVPLSASLSELATPPSPSSPLIANPNPLTISQQNMSYQIVNTPMQVSSLLSSNGPPTSTVSILPPSFPKTNSIINGLPVLSDHMDMARPPHENPEYVQVQQNVASLSSRPLITNSLQTQPQQPVPPARRLITSSSTAVNTGHGTIIIPQSPIQQPQQQMQTQPLFQTVRQPIAAAQTNALPIAIPVTSFNFTATNATNQTMSAISTNAHHGKYIRLSPKPYNAVTPAGSLGRNNPSSSPGNNLSQNVKSPIRRPRGDAKKCRKVYGMDHRDLWCTQCKWKKACTRFGESN